MLATYQNFPTLITVAQNFFPIIPYTEIEYKNFLCHDSSFRFEFWSPIKLGEPRPFWGGEFSICLGFRISYLGFLHHAHHDVVAGHIANLRPLVCLVP